MKNESKYTTIMIKKDLKSLMDEKIKELGTSMSYSELIRHLLIRVWVIESDIKK